MAYSSTVWSSSLALVQLPARGRKTDEHGACRVVWNTLKCFLSSPDTVSGAVTGAGLKTILCSLVGTVPWFLSGRGHHIPAPTWEGCRATVSVLLSCSALPAGGCRSSGWALALLAVVLLALVLFAELWVWGLFFET